GLLGITGFRLHNGLTHAVTPFRSSVRKVLRSRKLTRPHCCSMTDLRPTRMHRSRARLTAVYHHSRDATNPEAGSAMARWTGHSLPWYLCVVQQYARSKAQSVS